MESGKIKIINDLLFMLSFPLVAFDVFLFYDDSASDFELIGKLWLITFLFALFVYILKRKITLSGAMIFQLVELAYSSFVILFFVVNFFLVGMFVMMVYTRNQFII